MDAWINIENEFLQMEVDRIEDEIAALSNMRKNYTVRQRLNPMDIYDEDEFCRRFRLKKATVRYLYTLIGAELEPLVARVNFTINGLSKILITLRYYATASFHMVSADFYGVSESSVCNIVPIVSEKISALAPQFIRMPSTDAEIIEAKQQFFKIAGMPSVIDAIDGSLIKIQEVGGAQNKTDFFCRKQFYALNTQVICDANDRVIDIVARWPGSTHDETIFLNSAIFGRFLNGEFVRNDRHSILLGDGGYRAEVFLAIPLRETQRRRTPAEELYQRTHIATRNTIERFFGQWKKRFPCLWIGTRFRKLETVQNVIVATAVLHNICKLHGDHEPPLLSPTDEAMYNAAVEQERQFLENNNAQRTRRIPATISNNFLRNYFENITAPH